MKQLTALLLLLCAPTWSVAQQADSTLKNCSNRCTCSTFEQTPAGITTSHVHSKGEWMVSASYMQMNMAGNRHGNKSWSNEQVFQDYAMSPQTMHMRMNMLMAMYGITNRLTAMVMTGYTSNSMVMNMNMDPNHIHAHTGAMIVDMDDMQMKSKSNGFADTRLQALFGLLNGEAQKLTLSAGVSIPTGSITRDGLTMLGFGRQPYNMQIGSGTFDLLPGIAWTMHHGNLEVGAEAGGTIHTGKNNQGYHFGDSYHLNAWCSYRVLPFLSASLRAEGVKTQAIKGFDKDVAVLMYNDPCADNYNYGGKTVSMYGGLNFSLPAIKKLTLRTEYGQPISQNLNGVQMAAKNSLQATLQLMF